VTYAVRYADDFVVLFEGNRLQAEQEKQALSEYIRERLRMELSAEKTLVTDVNEGFDFLGYHIRRSPALRDGRLVPKMMIPKAATARFRSRIRGLTRSNHFRSLRDLLLTLNPVLHGWRNYYRFAVGAGVEFAALDRFTWFRIQRWLRRKFPRLTAHEVRRRYQARPRPTTTSWFEGGVFLCKMADGGTQRYRYRGHLIQNGWDDRATGAIAVYAAAADVDRSVHLLEELLRDA
jgi:hypothetical protein